MDDFPHNLPPLTAQGGGAPVDAAAAQAQAQRNARLYAYMQQLQQQQRYPYASGYSTEQKPNVSGLDARLVDQSGRPTQYDLTSDNERTGSVAATAAPRARPPALPHALPAVFSGGSPQLAGAAQAAAASCAPHCEPGRCAFVRDLLPQISQI